jgi:hypothetical protein
MVRPSRRGLRPLLGMRGIVVGMGGRRFANGCGPRRVGGMMNGARRSCGVARIGGGSASPAGCREGGGWTGRRLADADPRTLLFGLLRNTPGPDRDPAACRHPREVGSPDPWSARRTASCDLDRPEVADRRPASPGKCPRIPRPDDDRSPTDTRPTCQFERAPVDARRGESDMHIFACKGLRSYDCSTNITAEQATAIGGLAVAERQSWIPGPGPGMTVEKARPAGGAEGADRCRAEQAPRPVSSGAGG